MSVEILCPEGGSVPHPVVPSGTGSVPRGIICAHGEATREIESGGFKEVQVAGAVFAMIFDSFDPMSPANDLPPPGALKITPGAGGLWKSEMVPGARHSAVAPFPPCVLVIWAMFGGTGLVIRRDVGFLGITAAAVDCCDEAGTGGHLRRHQAGAAAGVALTRAPVLWSLLAAGFEGARAVFNGPWLLALRPGGAGHCTWDNGGDGSRVPRVELRCESPLAVTWLLTFRDGPGAVVEYALPAAEWAPLGPNVLRRRGEGPPAAPDALTIIPG